jgi:hypothetical protein
MGIGRGEGAHRLIGAVSCFNGESPSFSVGGTVRSGYTKVVYCSGSVVAVGQAGYLHRPAGVVTGVGGVAIGAITPVRTGVALRWLKAPDDRFESTISFFMPVSFMNLL